MRAKTLCSRPGCANTVPCHVHTYSRPAWGGRPNRPTIVERYKGMTKAMRMEVLKQEPVCMMCRQEDSTVVDHKDNTIPLPTRNERANLQGACAKCNRNKSKREAIAARKSRRMPPESRT